MRQARTWAPRSNDERRWSGARMAHDHEFLVVRVLRIDFVHAVDGGRRLFEGFASCPRFVRRSALATVSPTSGKPASPGLSCPRFDETRTPVLPGPTRCRSGPSRRLSQIPEPRQRRAPGFLGAPGRRRRLAARRDGPESWDGRADTSPGGSVLPPLRLRVSSCWYSVVQRGRGPSAGRKRGADGTGGRRCQDRRCRRG